MTTDYRFFTALKTTEYIGDLVVGHVDCTSDFTVFETPALAAPLDASHGATPPENLLSVSCPWTERYPFFAYVTSDGV
jgi:hypothetical protein